MRYWTHRGRGPSLCPMNVDPDSVLDFGIEWGYWFGDGLAIVSAEWDVGTLTKGQEGIRMTYTWNGVTYTNVTMITLSGFISGQNHTVRCRAFSEDGNHDDRSMIIFGQEQ